MRISGGVLLAEGQLQWPSNKRKGCKSWQSKVPPQEIAGVIKGLLTIGFP